MAAAPNNLEQSFGKAAAANLIMARWDEPTNCKPWYEQA